MLSNQMSSAEKTYNEASSLEKSTATSQQLSAKDAVTAIGDGGDWAGLERLIQDNNLVSDVNQKQAYLEDRLKYSPEYAHRAALLTTAINKGSPDCSLKALSMIGDATGNSYKHNDPYQNKDVNSVTVSTGDLGPSPEAVKSGVLGLGKEVKTEQQKIEERQKLEDENNKKQYDDDSNRNEQNKNAMDASRQLNNMINPKWSTFGQYENLLLQANNGVDADGEFEPLKDKGLREQLINANLNKPIYASMDKETRSNLARLFEFGRQANLSDSAVNGIIKALSIEGISNDKVISFVNTLRNTHGFQAHDSAQDLEKLNFSRADYYCNFVTSYNAQVQLLKDNKALYDTAKNYKGPGKENMANTAN